VLFRHLRGGTKEKKEDKSERTRSGPHIVRWYLLMTKRDFCRSTAVYSLKLSPPFCHNIHCFCEYITYQSNTTNCNMLFYCLITHTNSCIYIYIYIFMYVCVCVCACVLLKKSKIYIKTFYCLITHTNTCTHTHAHTHTHTHTYIYIYIYIT